MKLEDNAYGVSIRKTVQELTGKYWSIGAVYVPLERLEQKGYVKSFSSEPLSERGGRRKRLFRITSEGIKELEKIKRVNQIIWKDYSPAPVKDK